VIRCCWHPVRSSDRELGTDKLYLTVMTRRRFYELIRSATGSISTPTTSEYCAARRMTGAPAFTKNERELRPLRLEANNRWAVSETRANWYDPVGATSHYRSGRRQR